MAICFAVVVGVLGFITILRPMPRPVELPVNPTMNMTVNRGTKIFGGVVVALTLVLYVIFW
jgi:SSS family solute:Na+ symporter